MSNKKTALEFIQELPNRDRKAIINSKKDFVVFDNAGNYTLTNDLHRYRHAYQWGGAFGVLECIKQDIKPKASFY